MPVIGSSRLSYTLDASSVHGKEYYAPSQSKPKITPETNHDEAAKFIQETVSNKVKLYLQKCEYSAKVVDKNTCSTSFKVRCKYRGESTTLDLRVDFFSFELLQLRDAVKYVNAIVKEYEVKNTHIYALSDVHPVDLKSGLAMYIPFLTTSLSLAIYIPFLPTVATSLLYLMTLRLTSL